MLKHKHGEKALFSSRYASDLIVFKKYDYGANVQCFYALKSYKRIRQALGKSTQEVDRLLARMPADMKECMEAEGPFGRQITGGSSLGENREERFYIPEELYYYGGEDTATVRAPLYGLYGLIMSLMLIFTGLPAPCLLPAMTRNFRQCGSFISE